MLFVIAKILAFTLPLGLDTLAIAIAVGLRGIRPLRPAVVFAIFEGSMPAIGVLLAGILSARFATVAGYLGAVILIGIGIHAIMEAREEAEEAERLSFVSLRAMILAGFAVSIDEIAVGFPLATEHLPIVPVFLVIATQAFIIGYLGVVFGRRLGERSATIAGSLAGVAFIGVGVWLLVSHILEGR